MRGKADLRKIIFRRRFIAIDPFDAPKPRLSRRGVKAPLRVNPEQALAFMPESRRVDLPFTILPIHYSLVMQAVPVPKPLISA